MKLTKIAASASAIATASAQQVEWGQCGGDNWTGPTTCVAGTVCTFSNDFYSQCLPGTAVPTTTLVTSAKPTTTVKSTTAVSSPTPVPAGTFAKAVGRVFNIDGKVGYFAGTNSYWIGFLTNNADIDLVMSHLQTSGVKVLRVWGFNDVNSIPGAGTVYYQALVPGSAPVINTGANGLGRLDYVVQSAAAHGIKLIINFVNNWTDFGGQQAYLNYYGGDSTSNPAAWYTTATIQAQYKAYIAAVVSRYKTSTAVFAWELCNEPRCTGCATSVITQWATGISAYIKSLDPNHMVTMGDEGFGLNGGSDTSYPFTNGPGLNFTNNLQIPDIDFGTMHLYPSSWGEADTWGPSWITYHDAIGKAVGKPVILEEYGSLTITNEIPWQQAVLSSGIAGDMYWQYGDDLSIGETSNDGYAIYYGTPTYTTQVINHASAMNAKPAPTA